MVSESTAACGCPVSLAPCQGCDLGDVQVCEHSAPLCEACAAEGGKR